MSDTFAYEMLFGLIEKITIFFNCYISFNDYFRIILIRDNRENSN